MELIPTIETSAWKLFEVAYGHFPKTLVHGLPSTNGRTRILPIEHAIRAETGTPGFNVFPTFAALEQYLPRFRVRKSRLVACNVLVDYIFASSSVYSNYMLARWMIIPTKAWLNRIEGEDIITTMFMPHAQLEKR